MPTGFRQDFSYSEYWIGMSAQYHLHPKQGTSKMEELLLFVYCEVIILVLKLLYTLPRARGILVGHVDNQFSKKSKRKFSRTCSCKYIINSLFIIFITTYSTRQCELSYVFNESYHFGFDLPVKC